jgi:hypothetical protein
MTSVKMCTQNSVLLTNDKISHIPQAQIMSERAKMKPSFYDSSSYKKVYSFIKIYLMWEELRNKLNCLLSLITFVDTCMETTFIEN